MSGRFPGHQRGVNSRNANCQDLVAGATKCFSCTYDLSYIFKKKPEHFKQFNLEISKGTKFMVYVLFVWMLTP